LPHSIPISSIRLPLAYLIGSNSLISGFCIILSKAELFTGTPISGLARFTYIYIENALYNAFISAFETAIEGLTLVCGFWFSVKFTCFSDEEIFSVCNFFMG
jgi:hypothetical protein